MNSFLEGLCELLTAGLSLPEAIATLAARERISAHRELFALMLSALSEGRSFSEILSRYPQHFSPVLVATVRASERTGDLPQALRRYLAYEQQFESIRKKLVSAAIYPAMLLIVGTFVTLFLLGYVVPKFAAAYDTAGRDLPWLSAAMLQAGQFINAHAMIMCGLLLATIALAVWGARREQGRAWLLAQVLRIPWLAERVHEFRLARFYRGVSLLLDSGIPLAKAMPMVGGLLGADQQGNLALARRDIETGKSLSVALAAHGLITPVAESLIRVGERAGNLAEMLERTARFHDEEFSRFVDTASKLLEPLLMTLIGLVVGTVVVLMYIPIFELAGSLQ